VEQSNFDELTLEMDGIKLCLRRGAPAEPHPALGTTGSPPGLVEDTASATTAAAATAAAATRGSPPRGTNDTTAVAIPAAATEGSLPSPPATNMATAPADPNVHEVTSPLLGTFYRAPKPGASPFVEVGSQVNEGTVVAIIEVMKLMNTVRAGVRGTVTEILVADGALAEYGEPLLRVRKAG
jgi:acetyl-CoA carboxylase biotin carboxyl carrier protein